MKTFIKPLLVAVSVSLISLSTSVADNNPIGRPAAVASYKTGLYTTAEGKLNIALDKETGGSVVVQLKSSNGRVLYFQRIGKNQTVSRIRLDVSALADGVYQVEISNGVETTTHALTLATHQPSLSIRQIALN
ncbi:T9SS type A sorting domain-containing protein [Spirosoma areae]